jgi:hypothetical protein
MRLQRVKKARTAAALGGAAECRCSGREKPSTSFFLFRPDDHGIIDGKLFGNVIFWITHFKSRGSVNFPVITAAAAFRAYQINIGVHGYGTSRKISIGRAEGHPGGVGALTVADAEPAGVFHEPGTDAIRSDK